MIRFEDLLDRVRGYNPDADLELLRRAYVFSALRAQGTGAPFRASPTWSTPSKSPTSSPA